ncbi:MAG TPA: tyrosine-type recombinase/integrase [Gemmatimonadales bacterium]|nr:tyrosine-type recombinase/integrase [Gemmatimonadales bacterium]
MARLRRDARLETREARSRLPLSADNAAYWRTIEPKLAIGYYKGPQGGTWYIRSRKGNRYIKARLALADDASDSNGTTILSFSEAQRKALGASETLKPRDERRSTVEQAVADYIEHLKVRAKSWRDTEVKLHAHVLPKLGTLQLSELTPEIIRRWRDALARSIGDRGHPCNGDTAADEADVQRRRQASANRVFNALRACLNHAWREGKTDTDQAWRRVPAFRNVEAPVIRFITADEAVRLVNASDPEFRPLVRAALLTGCRYGELCALRVGDFDHENETLVIRHSKSGRPRHVYLTGEGAEFFEGLTVGRPREALIFTHAGGSAWKPSHQHRPMRDACLHAEIEPPVSFHILRHSYASLLTKAGVPLQVVASALGHADARMTEKHYAHLAPSHVAQLIRNNLPQLGGNSPKKARKLTRLRP